MLISEIIAKNIWAKPKTKLVNKRKVAIKGPYAPPPKPLPKPKPLKLTPLQQKQKRQSSLQTYAKVVQNTLGNNIPSPNSKQPLLQPQDDLGNLNQNRDAHERGAFLRQLRGETP